MLLIFSKLLDIHEMFHEMSKFKERHLSWQSIIPEETLKLSNVIRKFIRAGGQNVD